MTSIKPIVEIQNAGRRLRETGKERPIDAVQSFELDAARAGFVPSALAQETLPFARANWIALSVPHDGFAGFFESLFSVTLFADPSFEVKTAAAAFRAAETGLVADIVEAALEAWQAGDPPDAMARHDEALARAQTRYDLRDALNGTLVSNPDWFEIIPNGTAPAAWAARTAALPPATEPLENHPNASQITALLAAANLSLSAHTQTVLPGYIRVDTPAARLFAKEDGPAWILSDAATGQILAQTGPTPDTSSRLSRFLTGLTG